MEFVKTSKLYRLQKQEICDLWNNEYPENLNYKTLFEFEQYLRSLDNPSHVIMLDENQKIKGWYFDFYRDDEKWFALILNSECQGKGWGRKILNLAKEKETELNAWVIDHNKYKKRNGERYKSPLNFYVKNGFEIMSETRLQNEKIAAVKIKWKI